MAKLRNFRVDSKKIEAGDWIKPGEEFDDLEIFTRGFTDAYTDARAAKLRRAAADFGGDIARVPEAVKRSIVVDCLIKHVVMDVRNLDDDDDSPVSFAQFCDMLRSGDYPDLVTAVVRAAGQVGIRKAAEHEDAVGNSV